MNWKKKKRTKYKGKEKDPDEQLDIGMRICCGSIIYDSQVSDLGNWILLIMVWNLGIYMEIKHISPPKP